VQLTSDPGGDAGGQAGRRAQILVGLAGWSYADWNGILYPARRPRDFHEAAYLAQFFDAIEINTSFYRPIRPEVAAHWIERVAANPRFLFTAKLWQKFTHEGGGSADDERAVRLGFDVLRAAGRLGAVLLQFPFSFHNTPESLTRLRKILQRFRDYPLVVEVRHASWAQKQFYDFLHEHQAGFCNIDQPVIGHSIRPTERSTAAVGYVRLHGRRYDTWFTDDPEVPSAERYNYLYSIEELEPWSKRIRHVAERTQTTFVVANNHFEAKAAVNALQLIHLLTGNKIKVPDTLQLRYPQLESIASELSREPMLFPLPPP
jgi:uncharacterized protein YecE (DUF72 family)